MINVKRTVTDITDALAHYRVTEALEFNKNFKPVLQSLEDVVDKL